MLTIFGNLTLTMFNLPWRSKWVDLGLDGLGAFQNEVTYSLVMKGHLHMVWRVEMAAVRCEPFVKPYVLRLNVRI